MEMEGNVKREAGKQEGRDEKDEVYHDSIPFWYINFGPNYYIFNDEQYINSLCNHHLL